MIYSGRFRVTSPYGQRILNGTAENHRGIDVVGILGEEITLIKNAFEYCGIGV